MKEEVFAIFSAVMEIPLDDVSENCSTENVENWDSLRQLNLIFALEDNFDVKFQDDDILGMQNVAQILDVLSRTVTNEVPSGS